MNRVRLALLFGGLMGALLVFSCAIDESGTAPGDSGGADAGIDLIALPDVNLDATFDVPDLGVGETESGLPCTCVQDVPSGWVAYEYAPNQRQPCTIGYDASVNYIENPTAAATTCSCTCNGTPLFEPTCACGTDPVTFDISSGNGECTDITSGQSLQASTFCYNMFQMLTSSLDSGEFNNMLVSPPASPCVASGGMCSMPVQMKNVPAYNVEQGAGCSLVGTPSQGTCADTEVCIPNTGSPFKLCVTNFTLTACPNTSFPYEHIVGSTPVLDTRNCGPSACACDMVDSGACGTPQLSLWNSMNCGGVMMNPPDHTLPADGVTCTAVGYGDAAVVGSARYRSAQTGAACAFTGTYMPTGGLEVSGPFTICCNQ